MGRRRGRDPERLRRDVIAHRPTVVTVMLGMNDPYYMSYDPKILQAFKDSLESIVIILQKELPGVRITLLGTSPYDDVSPGPQPKWEQAIEEGYNSAVRRYSQATKEVADRHQVLYVDMNRPLVDLQKKHMRLNMTLPALDTGSHSSRPCSWPRDGCAAAKGLERSPPRVCGAYRSQAGSVASTIGATVTDVVRSSGLRWTQQDMALPFPMDRSDPLIALTLQCSPQLKGLVEQRVRITNLPNEKTSLLIDGQSAGVFFENRAGQGRRSSGAANADEPRGRGS